ncbi:MAG: SOS response-associated peptidase [Desulfobulbaceae bacterium]|nr:SOS response-associated peptidase [Desulfobulbaceae bacterium]
MCGRFTITKPEAIKAEFNLREEIDYPPRYNIAPSQTIPIIKQDDHGYYRPALVRWGLIPFWAKDEKIAYKMINARAETLAEKPGFREAYKKRRCLIPADGFFEWQRINGSKQPYYIRLKNKGLFTFAGLWEEWHGADGKTIQSATIITTTANRVIAKLHDRMPLIVDPTRRGTWLDLVSDPIHDLNFVKPGDPFKIVTYPVSRMVNNARLDAPGCIKKVG